MWLGSLIKVLEPLGISHRLVRTAAYRLVQDGILTSEQEGRRSFYTLTADGRRQFEEASERIYSRSDDVNGTVDGASSSPSSCRANKRPK